MKAQQLRLLPPAKPLSDKFGRQFFLTVPSAPGVYLMFGRNEQLLYVGQSANLRKRVGSYRYVQPGRSSRKIVRLVHSVERIEWQKCENAEASQLRENELLRTRRPKFNTLNTYPRAHVFIGLMTAEDALHFCYTRQEPTLTGYQFFGAFKTGSLFAYHAMLRLSWITQHQPQSPYDLPRQLLGKPPGTYALTFKDSSHRAEMSHLLSEWFGGESDRLMTFFRESLASTDRCVFLKNLIESDLALMEQFFITGAKRNRHIRMQRDPGKELIPQEELDDWIVRIRSKARE